ncbi:MAG TPA: class I SAM-dependent methyltransferase [Stellaceae bacterium]|jgi:hypothetical protein|nr:class I SAM-dependent methyltransferase [Stellaceae bacterium]
MEITPSDGVYSATHEFCAVQGEYYLNVLARLHAYLKPSTYFEIGTSAGGTLKLANCKSLAIDPAFQINTNAIGAKPSCMLFQCTSDRFFRDHSPSAIFGSAVDLAFLDGLHLFEQLLRDFLNTERHCASDSVVALHDCVPADRWMAERVYTEECKKESQRPGWWTGDVWKCLPALKKYRPDLRILVVDAAPTGLVLITNLDPKSSVLGENYWKIVDEFFDLDIAQYGIRKHQSNCAMISTKDLERPHDISKFFRL